MTRAAVDVDELRHLAPTCVRRGASAAMTVVGCGIAATAATGVAVPETRWACIPASMAMVMVWSVIWAEVRTDRRLAIILRTLGQRLDEVDRRIVGVETDRYVDGWLDAATGRPPAGVDLTANSN